MPSTSARFVTGKIAAFPRNPETSYRMTLFNPLYNCLFFIAIYHLLHYLCDLLLLNNKYLLT